MAGFDVILVLICVGLTIWAACTGFYKAGWGWDFIAFFIGLQLGVPLLVWLTW